MYRRMLKAQIYSSKAFTGCMCILGRDLLATHQGVKTNTKASDNFCIYAVVKQTNMPYGMHALPWIAVGETICTHLDICRTGLEHVPVCADMSAQQVLQTVTLQGGRGSSRQQQ